MTFDLAGAQRKFEADCLVFATEMLDAARAEIIRLTARVAELEGDTVRIVKVTAKLVRAATVFAEGSVDVSGSAVIVGFPHASNWLSELQIAIRELSEPSTALSTHTEEPKT